MVKTRVSKNKLRNTNKQFGGGGDESPVWTKWDQHMIFALFGREWCDCEFFWDLLIIKGLFRILSTMMEFKWVWVLDYGLQIQWLTKYFLNGVIIKHFHLLLWKQNLVWELVSVCYLLLTIISISCRAPWRTWKLGRWVI